MLKTIKQMKTKYLAMVPLLSSYLLKFVDSIESPYYEKFLSLIGETVVLKDFVSYAGGLDTESKAPTILFES